MAHYCSGRYGPDVGLAKLKDFHRRRLQVLVGAGPDILAFETIPNKIEAQVCSCCNSPALPIIRGDHDFLVTFDDGSWVILWTK